MDISSLSMPIWGDRTPRSDQIDVAEEVVSWCESDDQSKKGVVVEMPTGAGKTVTAMIIIRHLINQFPLFYVAFMVHRRELFKQTMNEFVKVFGRDAIDITAGDIHTNKPNARIRVCMEQTMASKFTNNASHKFPRCDALFIDECHSMNYQRFVQPILDRGTKVIGLSATPDDWRMLRFWHPKKILGVTQKQLEEMGVLVEPTFFTPEGITRLAQMIEHGEKGAPDKIKFSDCMRYMVPEMLSVEKKVGRKLRWIVKTQSKRKAHTIAEILNANGIRSRAFWSGAGGGKKSQMDKILDGKSEFRCAVVVQRFATGYDHAGIEGIVLTGEMLYSLFVQTVGRALRPGFPRVKDDAYVVDLAGNLVKYLDKYVTRRETPNPFIPERLKRKKGEGDDEKKNRKIEEAIDYDIVLHEVKLSHLAAKSSGDISTACLLAYCAVEAEKEAGSGDENAQARAKRTGINYWMLTKRATGGRAKMRKAIMKCKEAFVIWASRTPMPPAIRKELMSKRRQYALEKSNGLHDWSKST